MLEARSFARRSQQHEKPVSTGLSGPRDGAANVECGPFSKSSRCSSDNRRELDQARMLGQQVSQRQVYVTMAEAAAQSPVCGVGEVHGDMKGERRRRYSEKVIRGIGDENARVP